jgi:hypothetical protein
MKMNIAQSNKQAGMNNIFGGAEGAISNINDLAGTSYYSQILKGLQK